MNNGTMADIKKDVVGTKSLKVDRSVSFLENDVFVVEYIVSEHNRPDLQEAKSKKIQNLEDYKTFKKVKDSGQVWIGSCLC